MTGLSSAWLCARRLNGNLSFSCWDHDFDDEIEPPSFASVPELVRDRYEATLEARGDGGNALVVESLPSSTRATLVSRLKGFGLGSSKTLLSQLRALPAELEFVSAPDAVEQLSFLRSVGGEGHLKFDFFMSYGNRMEDVRYDGESPARS